MQKKFTKPCLILPVKWQYLFLLLMSPVYVFSQVLTNSSNIDIRKSWSQEPNGYTYPMDIYVPAGVVPADGFPVCISLHGNGGMGNVNAWRNVLSNHIIIAPSGYERSWNISDEMSDAPDVEMVSDLIDTLQTFSNINPDKIRILGTSNGGALANRIFIENKNTGVDIICAIVSHLSEANYHNDGFFYPSGETGDAGTGNPPFEGYDTPITPITGRRYLGISNTNDGLIPYTGGSSPVGITFLDAQEAAFIIAKSQGYTGQQVTDFSHIEGNVNEYSYLNGQVIHLNGDAMHSTNQAQKNYIQTYFNKDISTNPDTNTGVQNLCTADNRFTNENYFMESEIDSVWQVVYGSAVDYQGQTINLAIDIYYPKIVNDPLSKRPTIMMVHGGGFQNGNKAGLRRACKAFAQKGYVAVTLAYRLGFDESVLNDNVLAVYRAQQDANAAWRYLIDNADMLNIDTDWLFMGGRSAGAINSLNVAYLSQSEYESVVPKIRELLGGLQESGNTLTHTFSIKGIFNNWGSARGLAINPSEMIPMVSFHGAQDLIVPIDTTETGAYGSRAIHNLLVENGVCSDLTVQENGGHGIYVGPEGNTFRWNRASCFFKSVFCDDCTEFYSTEAIPAVCNESTTPTTQISTEENIDLFPNPAKNQFTIETSIANYQIEIIDVYGKIHQNIIGKNVATFDISNLTKGLYFVTIRNEEGKVLTVKKLLKKL